MQNKKNKIRFIAVGLVAGIFMSSMAVSAQTREFTFHMNTSYQHGNTPNCGYVATKADNEQNAYVTVTQFDKVKSPTISMWVAPDGNFSELTNAWSWSSTASRKILPYKVKRNAGSRNQLCAAQFYSGSVVIGGKWTP